MPQRFLALLHAPYHVERREGRLHLHRPRASAPARVYAGPAPDAIDRRRPLAEWHADDPVTVPAEDRRRTFFAVATKGGEEIVTERLLPLRGAQNFRDLGGHATRDGRRVRWGVVFRADTLAELDDADVGFLRSLGLRGVCDFRGDDEVHEEPNVLAALDGFEYWRAPVGGSNVKPSEWRRRFEAGEFADVDDTWLRRSYCEMIDRDGPTFGALYRRLAEQASLPAVFHCTAGKDRTGIASALLLLGLGVPRAVAVGDYALTSLYTGERIAAAERWFRDRGIDPTKVTALMGSRPETMAAALDHLDTAHGGIDRWLRERAGLSEAEIDALRELLLA